MSHRSRNVADHLLMAQDHHQAACAGNGCVRHAESGVRAVWEGARERRREGEREASNTQSYSWLCRKQPTSSSFLPQESSGRCVARLAGAFTIEPELTASTAIREIISWTESTWFSSAPKQVDYMLASIPAAVRVSKASSFYCRPCLLEPYRKLINLLIH